MHRQPSLFGADVTDPSPGDLAGLLAGPGDVRRMGGTARVTVTVDAAWRVHVLVAEFAARGLAAGWEPAASGGFVVRTAFSARIVPLARDWSTGAPAGLHLAGPALRLWMAAAGARRGGDTADGKTAAREAFDLRLGPSRDDWPTIGAALRAAGLPAVLVVGDTVLPDYWPPSRASPRRADRRSADTGAATAWPVSMSPR